MNAPSPEAIDAALRRHSVFLSFPAEVEHYFQEKIKERRIRHIFLSIIIGTQLYPLFAVADYVLLPDIYRQIWRFRLLVGFPSVMAVCFFFNRIRHHVLREASVGVCVALICSATFWLISQSRSAFAAQEMTGFFLLLVYGNVVVRYRFPLAFILSIGFLVFFVFVSLSAHHIPIESHINNFMLMFSTALLSLVGNYWTEIEERRSFMLAERDAARKKELQQVNITLEDLSYHDGLTCTFNKRYFDMRFPRLVNGARQIGTPLSVLFFDVDHFKLYNDHYGHAAGDKALIAVADLLSANFRRKDEIIARIGGEEFVGLLPGVSLERALETAEKIRQEVEQLGLPHEASPCSRVITISVGVAAMLPGQILTPQALLDAADAALYKAKASGRNRVVVDAGGAVASVAA